MAEEIIEPQTIDELKVGTKVTGTVTDLTMYGALVNIGIERDALLHISQLESSDFMNIEEVMNRGDEINTYVLKVDKEKYRVALTMSKPPELPWSQIKNGETYRGTVTRIERYGAFVDIGAERPGMVHVSEMTDGYVQSPSDVVSVGDVVDVRVIKLNRGKRQIDLSMKTPVEELEAAMEPDEEVPTAMAIALRRAMDDQDDTPAPTQRDDRRGRRDNQDDIIERTLRNHNN